MTETRWTAGAPSTSVAFAMILHPVLKRFDAMEGVMVRAIADDITLCMRLDESTAGRLDEFCAALKPRAAARCSRSASTSFVPNWPRWRLRSRRGSQQALIGTPASSSWESPSGRQSLSKAGCGSRRSPSATASSARARCWPTSRHAAHIALRPSLQRRFNYIMSTNAPHVTRPCRSHRREPRQGHAACTDRTCGGSRRSRATTRAARACGGPGSSRRGRACPPSTAGSGSSAPRASWRPPS